MNKFTQDSIVCDKVVNSITYQDIKEFDSWLIGRSNFRKLSSGIQQSKTSDQVRYKDVLNWLSLFELSDLSNSSEQLYLYLYEMQKLPKCYCGSSLNFRSLSFGYNEYCSIKCVGNSDEVRKKIEKTSLEKYGVRSPTQSEDIKEKIKQTNLKKFGFENPFQSEEIKEKIKQTNLKKFGVENPNWCKEVRDKINQTCLKKFGTKSPLQSEEVKNKIKQTNLKRYGVEHNFQSKEIREKIKQTLLKNYGVEHNSQIEEVKESKKQTLLKNYGVEHNSQIEEVKESKKQTLLKNYGVENPSQSKEIREKIKQTLLKNHGVEHPLQSKEIKEKIKQNERKKFFLRLINSDRLKNLCKPNFNFKEYKDSYEKYEWICCKCNEVFEDNIRDGKIPRCSNCYPKTHGTSKVEMEIFYFCKQYYNDIIHHDRRILDGKEIDILISKINLGIEHHGLYYHGEISGNKFPKYHYNKMVKAKEKGIQLIQIFEDEWYNKQNIVKSILLSKMGKIENKIFARKCKIQVINSNTAKLFYFDNHLQDYINGIYHIGLLYEDKLMSLITFGKSRYNKQYQYEILRFCNKNYHSVVGGLSKLIKYFIKTYKPKSIMTYVDARYGTGLGYLNSGFKYKDFIDPGYFYMINHSKRESRIKYQKHKLYNILESFDQNLTEWENMQLNGYDRIWDAGNYIYEWFPIKN